MISRDQVCCGLICYQGSQVQILPPLQLVKPQVIPEGVGPVISVGRSFSCPDLDAGRADEGVGVKARAEPDRVAAGGLDGDPVRRILLAVSGPGCSLLGLRVHWYLARIRVGVGWEQALAARSSLRDAGRRGEDAGVA